MMLLKFPLDGLICSPFKVNIKTGQVCFNVNS